MFTAQDLYEYCLSVPELDNFAKWIAKSEMSTNLAVWHNFALIGGSHHIAHVGAITVQEMILTDASWMLRKHYVLDSTIVIKKSR